MDDKRFFKLEIMNECTGLLATALTFCFTDLVPDSSKDFVGILFSVLFVLNIVVHMSFIIKTTAANARVKCKRSKVKNTEQVTMKKHTTAFKARRRARRA